LGQFGGSEGLAAGGAYFITGRQPFDEFIFQVRMAASGTAFSDPPLPD